MSTHLNSQAYQACLNLLAERGPALMAGLIELAQTRLRDRQSVANAADRKQLGIAVQLLAQHQVFLRQRFPQVLIEAVAQAQQPKTQKPSLATLRFDQLELMGEAQVQENVELARIQQAVLLNAETEIGELDARVCSALGLATIQPELNPLRPYAFGVALRSVLQQTQAEPEIRVLWMQHVGAALGTQLRSVYAQLNALLATEGVDKAVYKVNVVPHAPASAVGVAKREFAAGHAVQVSAQSASPGNRPSGRDGHSANSAPSSITMDDLHRLLRGVLGAGSMHNAEGSDFGGWNASDAQTPLGRFAATVPGALEALEDMQQVDAAVARMRNGTPEDGRLSQRLGREVAHLLVANIAQDAQLHEPVRQAVLKLEGALQQLATADPRYFTDRTHPARVLLDRITDRSMAFATVDQAGFDTMMQPVLACVAILAETMIHDHTPFAVALELLERNWAEQEEAQRAQRAEAVQTLLRAEQRNLLARKLGEAASQRPDALHAPAFVRDFLAGPWAQVLAHTQLAQGNALGDSLGYAALLDDLLWSVQPELVRSHRNRLMRVIPSLLPKLRAGLQMVGYPEDKSLRFFADLMQVHQQGIKPAPGAGQQGTARERVEAQFKDEAVQEPWLAPREAQNSGFMDIDAQEDLPGAAAATLDPAALPLGMWIEFLTAGQWMRAQLTWASPHGTLFMFTGANGKPHSMTLRTLERLLASNSLRLVSQRDAVSGALDAVAELALRNSVDVPL